MTEEQHSIF